MSSDPVVAEQAEAETLETPPEPPAAESEPTDAELGASTEGELGETPPATPDAPQ